MLGKRGLVPIFFLVCAGGAFAQPSDDVTISIAQAIGTSPQQVAEARSRDATCDRADGSADLSPLIAQAAQFAKAQSFPGTGEMATDFTRLLVAQEAMASGCDALWTLWQETDPLLRSAPEQGLGIAESDIAAAIRLDALGAPYRETGKALPTRQRVLALWDSSDPEDNVYSRLLLTRLNAWVPAVEAAWGNLTEEERYLATQPTFAGEVPDAEGQVKIIGHDSVDRWVWGGWLKGSEMDLAPYADVLALAESGYFGGRYFIELNDAYQTAISTMTMMTHSMVTMPLLFDMMEMTAQY